MYRPLFSALPVKRGVSVISASLLRPPGTSSRAFSHIPATAYMTSILGSSPSSSSSSSPSFRYKSPVGVNDLLRRSNSQSAQASLFAGMHTALPHTATPRAYSSSRSVALVRRFTPSSTGLCSGSRPISSHVSSFFPAVRKQPEIAHVNRTSVRTAQKYLSTTTLACMRVGGKPPSGSGNSFIEKVYPVTRSSSSGNGGREREMDALTPHVREHLFRVYSLLGATVVAAGLGSALMILTPLCQIIPGWLPLVGGFVPLLWLSFAPPADPTLKTALLLSFGLLEGMAIAPLVLMSSMKSVLVTSLALTGAIFGGFSAAAYLAPRASMLMLQGPLFAGLIGLMVLSLISVFYPTAIAHSLILYGGLALFSVMIAADTQAMIERARCGVGDHVSDAMQMFLSLINIFIRIMQIMGKD